MSKIVLSTLNARYAHTAIGLRYLYANLKDLQKDCQIQEFTVNDSIYVITEQILESAPSILGIGVYIWNAREVEQLVNTIKKVVPEIIIVLGGPEVSHLPLRADYSKADYIIQGEGEAEFYLLCKTILEGIRPSQRIIKAGPVTLDKIELPYKYYTGHDISSRVIYVEASRGCPFTCEFCLSSIDKSVRFFDQEIFLSELEILWNRGARKFKFIDRTFNLNIRTANRILDFFLQKHPPYLIHFEVVPDHFPENIKEKLKLFPPASLQLEIGIQTLNSSTAANINRKLDLEKIWQNISFLHKETNAHLHLDLIIGLPGETLEVFGMNLNQLVSVTNSEIQLGILKKLSGTSISRHDIQYNMVYSDTPPYEILQNGLIPFSMMQKMKRFARYWDLLYNSGNFNKSIHLLWPDGNVFHGFFNFSEWLYDITHSTWQISLDRLAHLYFDYITQVRNIDKTQAADALALDILKISGRTLPEFLRPYMSFKPEIKPRELSTLNKRQIKHL